MQLCNFINRARDTPSTVGDGDHQGAPFLVSGAVPMICFLIVIIAFNCFMSVTGADQGSELFSIVLTVTPRLCCHYVKQKIHKTMKATMSGQYTQPIIVSQ